MEYIAVSVLGPVQPSIINDICKFANNCHCNIVDSRFATLGNELVANLLLGGTWNAVAKFEAGIAAFERKHDLRITTRRTKLHEPTSDMLPYSAYVVAPDKVGIVYKITQFFNEQNIPIHDLYTNMYKAPISGTPMVSITLSVLIPNKKMVADIREAFVLFCDEQNYDAVMEPQKT